MLNLQSNIAMKNAMVRVKKLLDLECIMYMLFNFNLSI